MFAAIAVVLVLAWVLGLGVFHVAGGLIHLLLVLAVISILWHVISGRRNSI
ncbi:MAG: lmo0937 family membrane protein [Gemmatimonadota bacterium]